MDPLHKVHCESCRFYAYLNHRQVVIDGEYHHERCPVVGRVLSETPPSTVRDLRNKDP